MCRWQLPNPCKKCFPVIRLISVCQIVVQLTQVRLGYSTDSGDAGHFARKHEFARALEVHKGLDTETVSRGKQALTPDVPDREGPHSVEALDTSIPPLRIGMEDHLTVCTRMELVSCGAKLGYQFQVVVDLSI